MTNKIGPLGPIFYTPAKVASLTLYIKLHMNPEETSPEELKTYILIHCGAKKGPKNMVHSDHISYS